MTASIDNSNNVYIGCIDGLIRLQDGKNNSEGRVEICVKGAWNTVCDEGWDEYAAKVICREIGFDYAGIKDCSI